MVIYQGTRFSDIFLTSVSFLSQTNLWKLVANQSK